MWRGYEWRGTEKRASGPPATRLGISGSRPPDLNEGDDDNDDEIVAGRKMERSVLISDNVDDKVIEPKGNSFDDTLPSTTGSYLAAVAMGRKTKTNSVNQNKNKSQLTVSIHGTVAPSARWLLVDGWVAAMFFTHVDESKSNVCLRLSLV